MNKINSVFLIFALAFTWACSISDMSTDKQSSGINCVNSADCPIGELCKESTCQLVDCVTSIDCELEQYCTSNNECVEGCTEDKDCFAGDSCNTDSKECESYGCRDTVLDCEVGEFCNPMTQECYEDGRGHCKNYCTSNDIYVAAPTDGLCVNFSEEGSCTTNLFGQSSGCSANQVCFPLDVNDFNFQLGLDVQGTCTVFYKLLNCDGTSSQEQCPNGFSCSALQYSDGTFTDPVCYGDCGYYTSEGYIQ